jgi:hypothetical protein
MIELLRSTQDFLVKAGLARPLGGRPMHSAGHSKVDTLRATRRFGAFAVLTLRAIEKIRAGKMTAAEAAKHFEQVARPMGSARPATMTPSWSTCSSPGYGRPGKRSAVRGGSPKAINGHASGPAHASSAPSGEPMSRAH